MSTVGLLSSLPPWRWFTPDRRRRRHAAPARGTHSPLPPRDDDVPRGCAWYPSSFELAHGIDVHEDDAVARALA